MTSLYIPSSQILSAQPFSGTHDVLENLLAAFILMMAQLITAGGTILAGILCNLANIFE